MDSKGHSYKVVLLGNSGVGKTTLFNHLKEPNDVTAKSDFCSKTYAFGEDTVTVSEVPCQLCQNCTTALTKKKKNVPSK